MASSSSPGRQERVAHPVQSSGRYSRSAPSRTPHRVPVTALGCQPHTADKSGFRSHRGLLDCRRTKGCRFPHFLESNSVTVLRNFHGFARCIRRSTSQTLRGRPTGSCLPDTLQLPGFTSMRLAVLDPAVDLPNADGSPAAADIPCNVAAFPKIRNGKLEWMQVI